MLYVSVQDGVKEVPGVVGAECFAAFCATIERWWSEFEGR